MIHVNLDTLFEKYEGKTQFLDVPYLHHNTSSICFFIKVYDPILGRWRDAEAMSMLRSRVGVAVMKNRLYAIGGYNGSGKYTVDVRKPYLTEIRTNRCLDFSTKLGRFLDTYVHTYIGVQKLEKSNFQTFTVVLCFFTSLNQAFLPKKYTRTSTSKNLTCPVFRCLIVPSIWNPEAGLERFLLKELLCL